MEVFLERGMAGAELVRMERSLHGSPRDSFQYVLLAAVAVEGSTYSFEFPVSRGFSRASISKRLCTSYSIRTAENKDVVMSEAPGLAHLCSVLSGPFGIIQENSD